jgi:hypothetical protein
VQSREYMGFHIEVHPKKGRSYGFVATVTLTSRDAGNLRRDFPLLLDEDLATEEEAVREGFQYGIDLIDGLLPWFNPKQYRAAA